MPAQLAAAPTLPSLRAWRARRHLSRQALADAAGISARTVARGGGGPPAPVLPPAALTRWTSP